MQHEKICMPRWAGGGLGKGSMGLLASPIKPLFMPVHLWHACRDRRPVSIITRIVQLLGIAGGFLSKLAWDAANGRLKETEVDRAIDLRNIVVRAQPGKDWRLIGERKGRGTGHSGLISPPHYTRSHTHTHSHVNSLPLTLQPSRPA
jgi:hypothetical protein